MQLTIEYLRFGDETHSEETDVSRLNLGAVDHRGSDVLWRGSIAKHTIDLNPKKQGIY